MKVVYLVRHSKPLKDSGLANELIPLSEEGEEIASKVACNLFKNNVNHLYSSNYERAYKTAKYIAKENDIEINVSSLFIERKMGNRDGVSKEFWLTQLYDENAKCINGESQLEVRERMLKGLEMVLNNMNKDEVSVIVTHAVAITFLLMNYCVLKDASLDGKKRWLIYNNKDVINDSFKTPEIFKMIFSDDDNLLNIERVEYVI